MNKRALILLVITLTITVVNPVYYSVEMSYLKELLHEKYSIKTHKHPLSLESSQREHRFDEYGLYFSKGHIKAITRRNVANYVFRTRDDTEPPNVEIMDPPNESYLNGMVSLNIVATDNTSVDIVVLYINGTVEEIWSGGGTHTYDWDTTRWPDGEYNVTIWANDTSGNTNSIYYKYILDNTAPIITITSPLNDSTVESSFTVFWNTHDNYFVQTIEVYLNDSLQATYIEGVNMTCHHTFTGLSAPASYIVKVIAYDAARNRGIDSILVHTIGLSVAIVDPAMWDAFNRGWVLVNWTYSGSPDNFTIYANGTWIDTVPASQTWYNITGLAEGVWNITVLAEDADGNIAVDFVYIYIDFTDPYVTILYPSDGEYIDSSSVNVTWCSSDAGSGIDYYRIRIDGGTWIQTTNRYYVFEGLSDGQHVVDVVVYDRAGNSASDSVTFVVDTTSPYVSITAPHDGEYIASSSVTVSWSGGDNIDVWYYEIRIDGCSWINVGLSTSYTFSGLSDGEHVVDVRVVDHSGFSSIDSVTFIVDTGAPYIEITYPSNGSIVTSPDVTVCWYCYDSFGIDYSMVRIDYGSWVVVDGCRNYTFHGLSDGEHIVEVVVYDIAGNEAWGFVTFIVSTAIDPWGDIDDDGVPNYLDVEEFSVTKLLGSTTIEFDGWFSFEISWPVSLYILYPSNDLSEMISRLHEWGVELDPNYNYHWILPVVVEIDSSAIHGVLDFLENFPFIRDVIYLFTNVLCSDFSLRLMIVPEIKMLPRDFMDPLDLLSTIKSMINGDISDVVESIMEYLTCFDISLYIIKDGSPVVAEYVVSLSEILDLLEKIVGILTMILSIILELMTGVGAVTLAKKVFSLIVNYIMEWLPLPDYIKKILRFLMGIVNFKDPPGDFIYIQVYNKTGHLVLGYDVETGTYITCSRDGFMFMDADRYIFILNGNYSQYRIIIGRTGYKQESEYLSYSLIISSIIFNKTVVGGGALRSGEQTEVNINCTADDMALAELNIAPYSASYGVAEGEEFILYINITDENNIAVSNASVMAEIDGVFYEGSEIDDGLYVVRIPTQGLFGVYCVNIYVEKEGYTPDKKTIVLKVYDVTPPEVRIIQPENNTIVHGSIQIQFDVYEEHLYLVNVSLNDTILGSFTSNGTISLSVDTEEFADGMYLLKIQAIDRHDNTDTGVIILIIDNTAPVISRVNVNSQYREAEEIKVLAYVTDRTSGVAAVYLWYRTDGGKWSKMEMTFDGEKWVGTIPSQRYGTIIELYIEAFDLAENSAQSQVYKIRITMSTLRIALIAIASFAILSVALYLVGRKYNFFRKKGKSTHLKPDLSATNSYRIIFI